MIYVNWGVDLLQNGGKQKALGAFVEAIKIDDKVDPKYLGAVKVNQKLGRVKEAEADEAKAEELKPANR